jgi:hypothetical protein
MQGICHSEPLGVIETRNSKGRNLGKVYEKEIPLFFE